MSQQTIHRVSRHIINGLSVFVLCLVGGATILTRLGRFNPAPGGDEGTAARLFQWAIVLLLPAGVAFLVTADWRQPLEVARRLVLPTVALSLAFLLLYHLERLR